MTAILYGIKNCDTVKKARGWLDDCGCLYRFHDYKAAGIDRERLERWVGEVGWQSLLNRAGTTFRKLPDRDKSVDDAPTAIALMAAHPTLIKRPVLERSGKIVVGFDPATYARELKPGALQ